MATLTLPELNDLRSRQKISKNLFNALSGLLRRIEDPNLSPEQRERAREGLELASNILQSNGRRVLELWSEDEGFGR
jgi:hypothetical protein